MTGPLIRPRCEAQTMTILMDPNDLLKTTPSAELAEQPKTVTGRCENDAQFECQGYNVCGAHRSKILRGEHLNHG